MVFSQQERENVETKIILESKRHKFQISIVLNPCQLSKQWAICE